VLTEADGGPLAVALAVALAPAPASRHDSLVLQDILEAVVVEPPNPVVERGGTEQHLCLDKAFDGGPSEATAKAFGYVPHIRRIGEEKLDGKGEKKHPARRWVVERTIAWLNKCRGIMVRYDKKAKNYLALIQLQCALLWYRRRCRLTT